MSLKTSSKIVNSPTSTRSRQEFTDTEVQLALNLSMFLFT